MNAALGPFVAQLVSVLDPRNEWMKLIGKETSSGYPGTSHEWCHCTVPQVMLASSPTYG